MSSAYFSQQYMRVWACVSGARSSFTGLRCFGVSQSRDIAVAAEGTQGKHCGADGGRGASPEESLVPPQGFDICYEPGTRCFTMHSDSPVSLSSVVIRCLVSNRQLPNLEASEVNTPSRGGRLLKRTRRTNKSAYPTYTADELPITFTAFLTPTRRHMTIEALVTSQGGAMCLDGVTVHPGPLREDHVRLASAVGSASSHKYRGPLLNQRHLAGYLLSSPPQDINALMPYRQHLRHFFDPFVNRRASAYSRFDHFPVHTAPPQVADALVRVLTESGIDDELCMFVHRYALRVQQQEDALWRQEMDSLGILNSRRGSHRLLTGE